MTSSTSDPNKPLNAKQQQVVENYLREPNKMKAYLDAGYAENGAKQTAHQFFKRVNVAAEVKRRRDALLAKMAAETTLTEAWLIGELTTNLIAAKVAGHYGAVRAQGRDLMQYMGLLDREVIPETPLDEHVPLEERLKFYQREDDIAEAPNVTKLRAKANGHAKGDTG